MHKKSQLTVGVNRRYELVNYIVTQVGSFGSYQEVQDMPISRFSDKNKSEKANTVLPGLLDGIQPSNNTKGDNNMKAVKWLNRYFLDEHEEVEVSDLVWWYGIFGGSVLMGLVVLVVML